MFCCSGCALAARVLPGAAGGEARPAGPLVIALTVGFAGFNQVLFWLLSELLAQRADPAVNAASFAWVSLGIGAAVWLAIAVIQWRLGARRIVDAVVAVLGAALLALAFWTVSPACALAATATQAAWALRGLRRKRAV